MTVCTAHEYAGPKTCPYCEVAALQARVAELEDKLSLAVHGQTYDDCVRTLDASKSRVAELETENKQLCDRDIEANDALVAYETRIAQAVAELEAFFALNATEQIDPPGIQHIERALQILKQ